MYLLRFRDAFKPRKGKYRPANMPWPMAMLYGFDCRIVAASDRARCLGKFKRRNPHFQTAQHRRFRYGPAGMAFGKARL